LRLVLERKAQSVIEFLFKDLLYVVVETLRVEREFWWGLGRVIRLPM
jgi:hypothetical protein